MSFTPSTDLIRYESIYNIIIYTVFNSACFPDKDIIFKPPIDFIFDSYRSIVLCKTINLITSIEKVYSTLAKLCS